MKARKSIGQNPRALGTTCATGAVVLGLATLAAAGAPWLYLAINTASLLIGLVLLKLAGLLAPTLRRLPEASILFIPVALLATSLLGTPVEGIARWVRVGGISLQPGFLLLPLLVVAIAKSRTAVTTSAVLLAAAALALQPDRAMAGALAAALAALVLMRPDRHTVTVFAGSLVAFVATLLQPDRLAPAPHVEQVFTTAFQLHPLAGAAVATGALLLLLPPILGWRHDPANRPIHAAIGIFWLATLAAALLGAYPNPLVGYGGSAIIGYVLSVALFPRQPFASISVEEASSVTESDSHPNRHSRAANPAATILAEPRLEGLA
jgi:hypothetical protein